MDLDAALRRFRKEVDDLAEPYLWSDDEVLDYLGEAEVAFCRQTDGIGDGTTPDVCALSVVSATEWYSLHSSVLTIRSAHRADTGAPLEVINEQDMQARGWRFDGRAGTVKALVIGIEERKVRTWPKPNESFTAQLTVYRKPLSPISQDNDGGAFEIGSEHHPFLLLWAKHLAYSKQDAETFDRSKAADFRAQFASYCADVKREQGRLRHKPRTIAYGGL